jgi:glycosyltransferase involved in cell wall biosynthesis
MWAKNGSRTLPMVLRRIDRVIPEECVSQKILVDDRSTDNTVQIAKSFGWDVYENKSGYVSGGTNEALRHVRSEFFVGVEQDLLLSKEWWDTIPKHMEDPRVAVAQGIRLPTNKILRVLDEFSKYCYNVFSIDNNLFRTSVIRSLGGFPTMERISVDRVLFHKIASARYRWIIDTRVVSNHLKPSILSEIKHGYRLNLFARSRQKIDDDNLWHVLRLFATSPLRGLDIALRKKIPEMTMIYPYIRLWFIKIFLHRKAMLRKTTLEPKEWSDFIRESTQASIYPQQASRGRAETLLSFNRAFDGGP